MYRPRVVDEVEAGPGVSREEFYGQHVAFEPITTGARRYEVPRNVRAAVSKRMHVIDGRDFERQWRRTIDAAPTAVAHGCALDRPLLIAGLGGFGAAEARGRPWCAR